MEDSTAWIRGTGFLARRIHASSRGIAWKGEWYLRRLGYFQHRTILVTSREERNRAKPARTHALLGGLASRASSSASLASRAGTRAAAMVAA